MSFGAFNAGIQPDQLWKELCQYRTDIQSLMEQLEEFTALTRDGLSESEKFRKLQSEYMIAIKALLFSANANTEKLTGAVERLIDALEREAPGARQSPNTGCM